MVSFETGTSYSIFKLGTQSGLLQSCNVAGFPVFSVNIKGKNGYYTGQEVIYHIRIAIKTYLTQNDQDTLEREPSLFC